MQSIWSLEVMQLCSYAVMQLCSYAVCSLQLCSYAVMQFAVCSLAVLHLAVSPSLSLPISPSLHHFSPHQKLPKPPHLPFRNIHEIHPGPWRALPAPGDEFIHRGAGAFRFDINVPVGLIADKALDAIMKCGFPGVVAESDALHSPGNTDISMDNVWRHLVKGCDQN